MSYYSNPITFEEPSLIKIPKQLDVTIIGGPGTTFSLLWAYDYNSNYKSASITLPSTTESYYNVSEFNIAEYASPNTVVLKRANLTGSGRALTIGFQSTINGTAIDIQEFNIQALIGRIL
jgi:hypothetical protein